MKGNKNSKTKKSDGPETKVPPKEKIPEEVKSGKEITEEQEKAYLKGEEHVEGNEEEKKTEEEKKEVTTPSKERKQILIKPREDYLKDKISKMNCNEKLMTSIKKGLGDQISSVKTEIRDDNVLITQQPKNLEKYIPKLTEEEPHLTPSENYNIKQKHKAVKELKDKQKSLKNDLNKLKENEALLENQGFINLRSSKEGLSTSKVDKTLNDQQLKSIQNRKDDIIYKMNQIETQINDLIASDSQLSKKEILKSYIENFERDKEIAEIRAKKYFKETKERNQRMANDINQIIAKRKKEIEEKKKEAEQQKDEILKKFKEQEKAIEQKRSKENESKVLLVKPYIYEKPEKKASSCLFSVRYKNFQKSEENIIRKENKKKKELMKSIPIEEIQEFAKNFEEKKYQNEKKSEENRKKLMEDWRKAKENLPQYYNPLYKSVTEGESSELEENKKEKIEALIKNKKNYSELVKEERKPIVSEKLKKERMDKIFALENPKEVQVKATLVKQKNKRIILKKRDKTKPSKYKWELKLEEDPLELLNNSENAQNNLVRKPKKINFSSSYKRHEIPDKKIDYLKEMRTEKEKKRANSSGKDTLTVEERTKKWEKAINNSESIIDNINSIKEKADSLEQKALKKEQILRLNGGNGNNPALNKEIANLLIDSIEAKLCVLNQITKQTTS